MHSMRVISIAVLLVQAARSAAQDPCDEANHDVIPDPDGLRSAGLPTAPGAVRHCDSMIREGWWRIQSPAGIDMPTSCVEVDHCNTARPVWLNGEIPPADGNIHFMTGVTTMTNCSSETDMLTHQVDVKNCGAFRVYYLRRLTGCPRAYCFGTTAPCPPGTSSETGRTPNCTSEMTPFDQTPMVDVQPQPPPFTAGSRQIQFTCNLPNPGALAANIELQVWWYAGDVSNEFGPFQVAPGDMPHILHENVWSSQGIRLGINFWCKVRARRPSIPGEAPSNTKESNKYYAGIMINEGGNVVVRGEAIQIPIQPTAPVLNQRIFLASTIPTRYERPNCIETPGSAAFSTTLCGVHLLPLEDGDWARYRTTPYNLTVYGKVDFVINDQRTYTFDVVMVTPEFVFQHRVWDARSFTTKVTVLGSDVNFPASTHCNIDGDPHVRTFDSCSYSPQYEGEFIAYKRTDRQLPVQVNAYFQKCRTTGSGTCVCGVAVKSGSEVFIYDHCRIRGHDVSNQPIRIGLLECAQKSMDIVETSSSIYQITLPTGTKVKIRNRASFWGFDLEIYPSASDVQNVEGLCGNFDGDRMNDFIHRAVSGTPITATCSNAASVKGPFTFSWRITNPNESLYRELNPSNIGQPLSFYCRCPAVCRGFNCEDDIEARVNCTFDEFLDMCRQNGVDRNVQFRGECFERKRRKRALGAFADVFDNLSAPPFYYDPDYVAPEPEWRGGWTETSAREACHNKIYGSPSGQACSNLDIDYGHALFMCMSDIKILASDEYISAGVDFVRSQCYAAVYRNASMQDSQGKPPAEFTSALCPDDCSGHGQCLEGECNCEEGYGGNSCSINTKSPPTVLGTYGNGICDLSKSTCAFVSVYGGNILDSSSSRCKVEVQKMTLNGPEGNIKSFMPRSQYRHSQEVMCPLPQGRRRRNTETLGQLGEVYNIQISNDGALFSAKTTLLAYDSTCISCNPLTSNCKITGCYIDGACYSAGEAKPASSCLICEPSRSQVAWVQKLNTCLIGGSCWTQGQVKPGSSCLFCDPDLNWGSWTDMCTVKPSTGPSSTPSSGSSSTSTTNTVPKYEPPHLAWWIIVVVIGLIVMLIAGTAAAVWFSCQNKKNGVGPCGGNKAVTAGSEAEHSYATIVYPQGGNLTKENPYCVLKY